MSVLMVIGVPAGSKRALQMNRFSRAVLVLAVGLAAIPSTANATVTVNVNQTGPNVVATATGSFNPTGLTGFGTFTLSDAIAGTTAYLGLGDAGLVAGFSGLVGPASFGSGGLSAASNFSGTDFAINGSAFGSPRIFLPVGYVGGTAITSTATWLGQSLASLGVTPGQYVYTSQNDSVIVNIAVVSQTPEPSTWAMMLLGFGAIGFVLRRRRAAERSTAVA